MKFSMKVLMAMLMFCLPLAFTSCGDDDDEPKGPATYVFNYQIVQSNANPSDVLAIQKVWDATMLAIPATFEGDAIASRKLKVTAKTTEETKAAVAARVEKACADANAAAVELTLETAGKITVKVSGNGVNYSKKY